MSKYFLWLVLNSNANIYNNIIYNINISQCPLNYKRIYFGYNFELKEYNVFLNIKLYHKKNKYCSMNFILNPTLNTKMELDVAGYFSIKHANYCFINITIGYSYKNGLLIRNHIDIKKKIRINLNIKSIVKSYKKDWINPDKTIGYQVKKNTNDTEQKQSTTPIEIITKNNDSNEFSKNYINLKKIEAQDRREIIFHEAINMCYININIIKTNIDNFLLLKKNQTYKNLNQVITESEIDIWDIKIAEIKSYEELLQISNNLKKIFKKN